MDKYSIACDIVERNHELSADDLMAKLIIEYVEEHYPEYFKEDCALYLDKET